MKIIIVGGTGTLGKAIVSILSGHDLIIAGHNKGDIRVDIKNINSIHALYKQIGKVDAVVCAAGKVAFAPLPDMDPAKYEVGLQDKLMGQVNLVTAGLNYINDNGSFTLISGILSEDPIRTGSSAAMVNGAINAFVHSAAIELPRGLRINAVSPTVFEESMDHYADYFPGFIPIPVNKAAYAFKKSIEGGQTGQVYKVW